MPNKHFIIWDLGGTKCGAAKVKITDHHFECEKSVMLHPRDYKVLDELTDHIEAILGVKHDGADKILIAGAGAYDGYVLENANPYPFRMDFARLAWERNWPIMNVVHDYVPVLCSTFTPYIQDPKHATIITPGVPDPRGRHVVFGVGTGLGLKDGALVDDNRLWVGSNEMGHVGISFPPLTNSQESKRHQELICFLTSTLKQPITFETILSGAGLARLHQFCTGSAEGLSPGEVSVLLHQGKAAETAALFAWYLGLFVGCVQLCFMPTGGLWMTGGVLKKNPMLALNPALQQGINAHPAYSHMRQQFPLAFITSDELAYLGAAWYASL
ncbi:MAG: glk [Gammaproteobacteria bacterium]|jgi:glucokinase|nr:glk [Gammaproteobacteria bacterium]